MVRIMKAVCIVFTATAVLFVLVNFLAAYLYPHDTRVVILGHPVFNEATRATYEGIYQLPISVIREVVGECYAEDAWIFEPYVQFRERPRSGQFVNISPDGFRLNARGAANRFDPAAKAVFLFGGSTTFGYGVRDQDTIAAHLEVLFRERRPEEKVSVYNFGRGYYGSSQEFLLLKSLVQRGVLPRVAVFLDGVNEAFCPAYSANIAEMFKIAEEDPWAGARAVVTSLPMRRLLRTPYRSELAQNALYLTHALKGYSFECSCPENTNCHLQFVKSYALNKDLVRTIGKQFGFDTHFILQPVGGYRNRFTTSPYGPPMPDRTALWQWLEQHSMNGEGDHSFAGILENFTRDAFVDQFHYTSAVHRLIAEAIYPSVVQSLDRPARK